MKFRRVICRVGIGLGVLLWAKAPFALEAVKGPKWQLQVPQLNASYVDSLKKFLEGADDNYSQFFKSIGLTRTQERPLRVRIFSQLEEFKKFQKENSQSKSNSAFYSLFNSEVYTWEKGDTEFILRNIFHETTHHYIREFMKSVPRCLDEGLAEVFESGRLSGATFTVGDLSQEWVEFLKTPTFKKERRPFPYYLNMQPKEFVALNDGEGSNAHLAQCWATSQFLYYSDGGEWRPVLKGLLEKSGAGDPAEKIIKESLPNGITYEQFIEKWDVFMKRLID